MSHRTIHIIIKRQACSINGSILRKTTCKLLILNGKNSLIEGYYPRSIGLDWFTNFLVQASSGDLDRRL